MPNEILKEFLISVGFKIDESGAKRAAEAINKVERQRDRAERTDQDRADAEQKRMEQRRRNSQTLALFLGDYAKVAAGAAVAIGSAMVAMAESIRKGIGEFDKLYYTSGRTGSSVNNIKALGYAFSQTGSSAEAAISALENFSRARRANPGIDAMLKGYGVNTKGDTADVLSASIDAIQKRHPQYAGAQVAELLGISSDEYDHLIRYRKEIGHFTDEYKRMQTAIGVNGGETADAAKEIMRQLGRLSAVFEVLSDKLTQIFVPAIKAVTTALGGIADWFADESKVKAALAYFDPIIGAVKTLTGWLKQAYEMFVKMFEYVRASPLGKAIGAIDPGYVRGKVLEALQPGSAEAATNPEGDTTASKEKPEQPGVVQRGWNAVKRGLGFGPKQDKTDYKFDGKHAEVLRQAAKELGTSPEDLATVISYESKFRPGVWGGKGGNYMGLIQFGPNERRDYGANDKQSFSEQMPAVVRYLKSRGFKPGMGLNQLYATINGGNPYANQNKSDGNGTIGGHVERMRISERARVQAFLGGGGAAPNPAPIVTPRLPSFARPNAGAASPGTFDLDAIMRSQPMGSTTSNVDNRRNSDVKFGDTNVTIHGNGNPQDTANSFKRAQQDLDSMRLRDVTTAIR